METPTQYATEAARRMTCRDFTVVDYIHHTGGFDLVVATELEAYRAAFAWKHSKTTVSSAGSYWVLRVQHGAESFALKAHQESYRLNVTGPAPSSWHARSQSVVVVRASGLWAGVRCYTT